MKRQALVSLLAGLLISSTTFLSSNQDVLINSSLERIKLNRANDEPLSTILPIVHCSFTPSKYERILLSTLRDKDTSMAEFRKTAKKIAELLVFKVVECMPTTLIEVETPIVTTEGEMLTNDIELVSIMRSGDALLDTFIDHFPHANVSKFLIQRDEETAKPHFKYMKLSSTISSGSTVIITEPMIATGGTLEMVIKLLQEKGVKQENIIIACVCAAPEGLLQLNQHYPHIKVVMTVMDDHLNNKKYIVPGLGDFGDRFFGTTK